MTTTRATTWILAAAFAATAAAAHAAAIPVELKAGHNINSGKTMVSLRITKDDCKRCIIKAAQALNKVNGVLTGNIDIARNRATFALKRPIPIPTLMAALRKAGYAPVQKV